MIVTIYVEYLIIYYNNVLIVFILKCIIKTFLLHYNIDGDINIGKLIKLQVSKVFNLCNRSNQLFEIAIIEIILPYFVINILIKVYQNLMANVIMITITTVY